MTLLNFTEWKKNEKQNSLYCVISLEKQRFVQKHILQLSTFAEKPIHKAEKINFFENR